MEKFGEQAARAIRRFGAFTLATATFIKLSNAISAGIDEAIKYDREMVRLSQVTGQTLGNLQGLSNEVTRLSKEFGASSSEILGVSVTLAQAGLNAKDTQKALEAIAKTAVSSTFGNMADTGEAAIAVMQQFGKTSQDLERILSSINAVSARYAVESEDITVAIRRAGGAFQAAGGQLEEFEALFTSVRQTTRESAETIATGFRTIFTRLQRGRTQDFLQSMGIDLRDAEQQFVGPYEAIRRISIALKDIKTTDPRFSQIIEELGGFRQISKVIPLLTKFQVSQEALNVAIRGGDSLAKDAAIAQQALSIQISKVKEEFLALIRTFTNSSSFRGVIELTLKMTSALIKLFDALQPVLPLLSAFAAVKIGGGVGAFATGFKRGFTKFATGGQVGGSGNGDTVPAMLTPGEFVITKRAAKAIGISTLNKLNSGTVKGYAAGGSVGKIAGSVGNAVSNPLIALAIVGSLQGLSTQVVKADSALDKFIDGIGEGVVQFALLATVIRGLSSSLPNSLKNIGAPASFRNAANDTRSDSQIFRTRYADSIRGGSNQMNARAAARTAVRNRASARLASNIYAGGGALLGAAGIGIGSYLSDSGNAQIAAGTGGTRTAALGGAAAGAGIGAGIGSVFGPLGTIVGGVVGGMAGYVTSLEDANRRLKAVQFEKSLDKVSKRLEAFSKGGVTSSTITNEVTKSISDTLSKFSASSGDEKTNLQARFNQDVPGLERFFNDIAANSATLEDFNKKTKNTLVEFAILSEIPFPELEKQIKGVIEATAKQKNVLIKINEFQAAQARQIIILNAFSQAIAGISENFRTFDETMSNINANLNGSGSSFLARDTSSVFSNAREGRGNPALVEQFSGQLGRIFGPEGGAATASAVQDTKILSALPGLIQQVQSQSPLTGEDTDFSDRLEALLQKNFAGADSSIGKLISKLADIQQGSGDDQRVSRQDPFELAAELGTSIGQAIKVFEEMAPQFQQQAERIKNAFAIYEQAQLKGANILTEIRDKEDLRFNSRRENRGEPIDLSLVRGGELLRRQSISGGPVSVRDMAEQLRNSQAEANDIGQLASETVDPSQLAIYAKRQADANVAAQRAAQALRAVADSSTELNAIQEKMAIEEQKRQAKLNYVNVLAFGGPADKAQLAKDQSNTAKAFKFGIGSVAEEDRSGILNLLESMPKEAELFGTTAEKVLQKIQESALGGKTLEELGLLKGSSNESKELQVAQDKVIQEQIDALNALRDNAIGFGDNAAKLIGEQNQKFLDDLRKIFVQRQVDEVNSQITEVDNSIAGLSKSVSAQVALNNYDANGNETKTSTSTAMSLLNQRGETLAKEEQIDKLRQSAMAGFTFTKGAPDALGGTAKGTLANVIAQGKIAFAKSGLNPEDFTGEGLDTDARTYNAQGARQLVSDRLIMATEKQKNTLRQQRQSIETELGGTGFGKNILSKAGNTSQTNAKLSNTVQQLLNDANLTNEGSIYQQNQNMIKQNSENRKSRQNLIDKRNRLLTPPAPPQPTSSTGNTVGQNVASTMNNTVNAFSTVLNGFSSVIQGLPTELSLQANHKVEVIINGAEMFANLQPEIQAMVVNQTKTAINNMIDTKFPDVGRMA